MKLVICLMPLIAAAYAQDVQEEMTVTLKDIRVHVLDRDGMPVRGLTKADFALTENGAPAAIEYFEEVWIPIEGQTEPAETDAAPDAALPRERYLTLFLDSGQMRERNFELARQKIAELVDRHAGPQTYFKLVHLDGAYKQLVDFTPSPDLIKKKLGELKYSGLLLFNLSRAQRRVDQELESYQEIQNLQPGDYEEFLPAHVNQAVEEKARLKYEYFRAFYFSMLGLARAFEYMNGSKSIFLFTGGGHVEPYGKYATIDLSKRLNRELNGANVTVYSLLFASPNPILFNSGASLTDEYRYVSSLDGDGGVALNLSANTIRENRHQYLTAPMNTAEDTGGLFEQALGAKKADRKLDLIETAATHYYRIGCILSDADKPTKIDIALRHKPRGVTLFYGGEFNPRIPYVKLDEEERDIALEAMLTQGNLFRNDLEAEWSHHLFPAASGQWRLAALGKFAMDSIPENGYEFGFIALDEHRQKLDQTIATLTQVPKMPHCHYYDVLIADQRPAFLRVSLRDMDTGALSFMEFPVEADPPQGVSDIVMTGKHTVEQVLGINQLRGMSFDAKAEAEAANAKKEKKKWWALKPKPLRTQRLLIEEMERERQAREEKDLLRRDIDPFRLGEARFFNASLKPYVFRPGVLFFLFHLDERPERPYQVQTVATSPKGILKAPVKMISRQRFEESGRTHCLGVLDASGFDAGQYGLWVRAIDPETGQELRTQTAFAIEKTKRPGRRR